MFVFPTEVDKDGVKANLKNGILSIVFPKAPADTAKKIRIAL
jgi:HSP20 family protein